MKTLKKNVIAVVMALVLVLSPMQAFAAELPTEAVYDLEKGGTQHFTIQDENGEIAEVTIEEIVGDSRVANGDYKVSYEMPLSWTAGFSISVSNNQIYDAYSPFHVCILGKIRFPGLTRPSVTKASYAFIYDVTGIYISTGVDATISGTELVVTKR